MEGQHFDAHNALDILDCDNSDAGDSDSSSDNECWEQIQVKSFADCIGFCTNEI